MDKNTAIEINNVSKKFAKTLGSTIKYGLTDITRSIFFSSPAENRIRKNEFWALKDISFNIKKGESWGIIGANGSGKSTILKLLSGIFYPDKGVIEINGRLGALIEIGAGFHPMLTGKENIYVNGVILGMTKKEIDDRFDKIVDFAGVRDFLDTPVKNYSSGMYVRLGFSVAVHSDPDILLVDEVLSVGDESFQQKCFEKMKQISRSNRVVIFVSHNMLALKLLTQKAVYIKNGKIMAIGRSSKVVDMYLENESK